MPLRSHPITGEPILFAPERASRPRAFQQEDDARCPFCPGHESDTPPTIAAEGDPWRVRVFANKYPPVEGAEVIVESPNHDQKFDAIEHAEEAVRMYAQRYRAHADAAYTAIFKNEGTRAGASIPHVHSQVMPVTFTPPRIAREAAAFTRAASCPLCLVRVHVIDESDSFRWLAPEGSSLPYQQWLVPKRHVHELSRWTDAELRDAASLLRRASGATLRIADSYNWMFLNFPRSPAAHSYIELVPRLAAIAGFELATGTFVEIIDPAAAAERLRRE
jgi:UDPglucose--hexose-1-phosphate uridylyltransferase